VIIRVNRLPVQSVTELQRAVREIKAGEPTLLLIHRRDTRLFIAVASPTPPRG